MGVDDFLSELNEAECWEQLDGSRPGRIAFTAGGFIDIAPVNYIADGRTLLFHTIQGNKLLGVTANPSVAFETDGRWGDQVWSVVVHGQASELTNQEEIYHAESLGLVSWAPHEKTVWMRIIPDDVSGRRFTIEAGIDTP